MAGMGNNLPDTRDPSPEMSLNLISGTALKLPEGFGQGTGLCCLSSLRGYWLTFCSQQLPDFRTNTNDFDREEIKIVGGSVDLLNKTGAMPDPAGRST